MSYQFKASETFWRNFYCLPDRQKAAVRRALSPFALKVEALLRFAGVRFRWLPASGGFFEALRLDRRRRRLVAGRIPLTWPQMTELGV